MTPQFQDYETKMRSLPAVPSDSDVLNERFVLAHEGTLEAFYAPLHGVARGAEIVIVGLTPGLAQMRLALQEARGLLRDGWRPPDIFDEIRRRIAFAGAMRTNLIAMLDEIGLANHLGLATTAALFDCDSARLHSTSALRYPVLKGRRNYSGSPKIARSDLLRQMALANLPTELKQLPDAIVVPLGRAVEDGLSYLQIDRSHRILVGFPHPSGGNGHRVKQFKAEYRSLRKAVQAW